MYRSAGFTMLELVLVIIILLALLGVGASYYMQLHAAMRAESIKTQANNFRAAVTTLRSQWMINRLEATALPYQWNDKVVYLTQQGWLANSDPLMSATEDDQTAYECWQLWRVVFNTNQQITFDGVGKKGAGDQHVSSLSGKGCRFEISNTDEAHHFFDYSLETGRVTLGVEGGEIEPL